MGKIYLIQSFLIIIISLFSIPVKAQNPTYLLELKNDVQVSGTEYEFDIYLLRTGTTAFEYASGNYGIVINPLIKNGGTLLASMVASSPDPLLDTKNQEPASVSFYNPTNVIRVSAGATVGAGNGTIISNVPPGTRICRVRLSNDVAFGQFQPNLTWTTTTVYPTQIYAYVGGTNTAVTNHTNHTTNNLANPILNVVTSSDGYNDADYDLKVYPNPFSDRITIDYNLLKEVKVRLSVFDTSGRMVEQLVDEVQQAGSYSLPWISALQPEGVYIVKLQEDDIQKTSRITLIR